MDTWYARTIIPRLLRADMDAEELIPMRRAVLADARGIVLEIGVGLGCNLPLYESIDKLYALEPSETLLTLARERMRSSTLPVEYLQAGAERVPLPDGSVDTVVSTWTLCSVEDPEAALREVVQVLRPGGTFLFIDHGASPARGVRIAQRLYSALFSKPFTGNCHYDRDIEALVRGSGLTVKRMAYTYERAEPLLYTYQGVAVRESAPA